MHRRRRHGEEPAPPRRRGWSRSSTPSSRPRATISPVAASGTFCASPVGKRWMPPTRWPSSSRHPSPGRARCAPRTAGRHGRHAGAEDLGQRRALGRDAVPGGGLLRGRRVCRSAFHSRWIPLSCSAAPSSTETTAPLAASRDAAAGRLLRLRSRSSSTFSSSASSWSASASSSSPRGLGLTLAHRGRQHDALGGGAAAVAVGAFGTTST